MPDVIVIGAGGGGPVVAGYDAPDADACDAAHRFPLRYEDLVPYYE